MKKWINSLMAAVLVLGIASPAWAASSSGKPRISGNSSHSVTGTSGVSSPSSNNVNSSGAQRPSSTVTDQQTGSSDSTGKTYNSGPQRPSSAVTQQPSPTTTQSPQGQYNAPTNKSKFGGVGSFLGGMAVGGLLGSMFHPFGGGMNTMGATGGFSFMGLLVDILIIASIVWLIRKFFWRRA